MPTSQQKRINRRAIYGSLVVWLAVQFTQVLKPLGIPTFLSSSLLYAGLVCFPALILWPWLKDLIQERSNQQDPLDPTTDRYLDAMINFEIIVLSGMLLFLGFVFSSVD